jgi:hypothetical protein
MSQHFENLKAHILALSDATSFDAARGEWALVGIEMSEELDECPCGHAIKEHCHIRNARNGNTTYVGNVCIKQFVGIDTGNTFDGLRRIKADPGANANLDLINHAFRLGYLFEGEYKFLMETRLKRKLSGKQLAWKEKISRRILSRTVVRRRGEAAGGA